MNATASVPFPSWFTQRRSRRIYLICYFALYLAAAVSYLVTDTLVPLCTLTLVDLILVGPKRKLLKPEQATGALAERLRDLWGKAYVKAFEGAVALLMGLIFVAVDAGTARLGAPLFTPEQFGWCILFLVIRLPSAQVEWDAPDLAGPEP